MTALNEQAENPSLWDDPAVAHKILQERTALEKAINAHKEAETTRQEAIDLLEMAEAEQDTAMIAEAEAALFALQKTLARRELEALLSGEADKNDCYLAVNAGAGGTESQDWAEMVLRMYMRWAERTGYGLEFLEQSDGDGAGIKSATLKINGLNAYGWLKAESGVHRLVRISPFDSNAKRHTSFCSVWVYPVVDDNIDITIEEKDLRVDTYRASGAGGQHVNKTDSAIRITHIPTNTVVQCQSDRSQHRNRAEAYRMLKARLYEMELQQREAKLQMLQDKKTDIGWGHQIRSYVLHPYQMIKDLRTAVETSNTQAVLDGDINMFLEASLAAKVGS